MPSGIKIPENKLSKDVIKVKIIDEAIQHAILFIVLGVLFYLNQLFTWDEWIGWLLIGMVIITLLFAIWFILVSPFLLYKNWRYHVDEEFLQLKSGALKEKHQLVPMTKVQSVETNQGPILRKYGLYSLSIETMGSSHKIPALPEEVAISLRNQIAHFAKIKEVDEW
ncbi:MAG TPA: PH domain-containing protein [Virgibacillus sp.]|nr:PH domain-containing protein [Virgibacillus sp.]